jgi:hypothetical protein
MNMHSRNERIIQPLADRILAILCQDNYPQNLLEQEISMFYGAPLGFVEPAYSSLRGYIGSETEDGKQGEGR